MPALNAVPHAATRSVSTLSGPRTKPKWRSRPRRITSSATRNTSIVYHTIATTAADSCRGHSRRAVINGSVVVDGGGTKPGLVPAEHRAAAPNHVHAPVPGRRGRRGAPVHRGNAVRVQLVARGSPPATASSSRFSNPGRGWSTGGNVDDVPVGGARVCRAEAVRNRFKRAAADPRGAMRAQTRSSRPRSELASEFPDVSLNVPTAAADRGEIRTMRALRIGGAVPGLGVGAPLHPPVGDFLRRVGFATDLAR
jgi:hypothetical protein